MKYLKDFIKIVKIKSLIILIKLVLGKKSMPHTLHVIDYSCIFSTTRKDINIYIYIHWAVKWISTYIHNSVYSNSLMIDYFNDLPHCNAKMANNDNAKFGIISSLQVYQC